LGDNQPFTKENADRFAIHRFFSFSDIIFGLFYFLQLCLVGKLERKKLRFRERKEREIKISHQTRNHGPDDLHAKST